MNCLAALAWGRTGYLFVARRRLIAKYNRTAEEQQSLIAQALELLEQQAKELQEKQHVLQQKVNQVNNDNKSMLDLWLDGATAFYERIIAGEAYVPRGMITNGVKRREPSWHQETYNNKTTIVWG